MKRKIFYTLVALIIIIPIGFYAKFYNGISADWVNNSLGGVFYEIFWCLILFLFFKKINPSFIALIVFLITCILEISQLWKPEFLELLRTNFLIRTVIGSTFVWSDFLYYIIGSLAGFGLMIAISKVSKNK